MNNFYDEAIKTAYLIKEQYPSYAADPNAAVCVILTNEGTIFAGVTGIAVHGDTIVGAYAELAAAAAMKTESKARAVKTVTLSLNDLSIITPDESVISALFDMNSIVSDCEILTSRQSYVSAAEMTGGNDFFAGFDDDIFGETEEISANSNEENSSDSLTKTESGANGSGYPSKPEFSSSVTLDENNPFFEPADTEEQKNDVKFFAEVPDENNTSDTSIKADRTNVNPAFADFLNEDLKDPQEISKEDLLKQAKQRKKIAKARFGFKK